MPHYTDNRRLLQLWHGRRGSGRPIDCGDETVRDVIRAFDERGLKALQRASSRPHHIQAAFTPEQAERLREILHTSPRESDKLTSV